jgi:hypothetical protein
LIEIWETYLMRLDADDEEDAFPRHPAPGPSSDISRQEVSGERPVSQDTDSTEAEAKAAADVTRDIDE